MFVARHPKAAIQFGEDALVLVFALLLREQLGERLSAVIKLLLSGKLSVINIVPSWQWDVCILPYFAVQSRQTRNYLRPHLQGVALRQLLLSRKDNHSFHMYARDCATALPFVQKGQFLSSLLDNTLRARYNPLVQIGQCMRGDAG
jgi:hypothetical protein